MPSSYTNFGKRVVALSAPGGAFDLSPTPTCDLGYGSFQCAVYDLVASTALSGRGRLGDYGFFTGTSFAAPHVVGVAALAIGKRGGAMRPSQLERILRRSADDRGPRGRDAVFGWGRVNAERAIQMTPPPPSG